MKIHQADTKEYHSLTWLMATRWKFIRSKLVDAECKMQKSIQVSH